MSIASWITLLTVSTSVLTVTGLFLAVQSVRMTRTLKEIQTELAGQKAESKTGES